MYRMRSLAVPSLVATLLGVSACAVRAYPPAVGGYPTAYADDVPADVYGYPHVAYDGGYAYLVHDRWYYPSSRGWVTLRSEPNELRRFRTERVQPRAHVEREPRRPASPEQYSYPRPSPPMR